VEAYDEAKHASACAGAYAWLPLMLPAISALFEARQALKSFSLSLSFSSLLQLKKTVRTVSPNKKKTVRTKKFKTMNACKACQKNYPHRQSLDRHLRSNPECRDANRAIIDRPNGKNDVAVNPPNGTNDVPVDPPYNPNLVSGNRMTSLQPFQLIPTSGPTIDQLSDISDSETVVSEHIANDRYANDYTKPDSRYSFAAPPKISVPKTPKPATPNNSNQTPKQQQQFRPQQQQFQKQPQEQPQNNEGCDKLMKKIVELLEKGAPESKVNDAGKEVLEDRVKYEQFLNFFEPYLREEQQNALMIRNNLIRENGITPAEMEIYKNASNNAPDRVALKRISKVYLCGHTYFEYDAMYNERFNKTIIALKIMRYNVDNYRHITSESDIMQEKMTPMKVFEVQQDAKGSYQVQVIFWVISVSSLAVAVGGAVTFLNVTLIQIFAFTLVALLCYTIHYVKTTFVDKSKLKLF
jgi:hypothetical protein